MKYQAIQIFKLMYCALDDLWSKTNDVGLSIYLSEANPFLCEKGSADPIVYNDFAKLFGEEKEIDDFGYAFIITYLKQLDTYYGDILSNFAKLTREEYVAICERNISLSDEELKNKYV